MLSIAFAFAFMTVDLSVLQAAWPAEVVRFVSKTADDLL